MQQTVSCSWSVVQMRESRRLCLGVSPYEPACCKAVFVRPAALQANIDLAAGLIQLRPMFALPAGKNGFRGTASYGVFMRAG